jgi:ATP-dependent DNA ligase
MPIPLMLATLTDRRDFGDDWLLERKLDGERCVARNDGGDVRLGSRTGKDLTGTYPEVRAAVAAQRARDLLLGGEVVAYDGEQTSFSRRQYAGKVGTGYTAAMLRDLGAQLRELETPESPFVDARPIPRGTHWTRPKLVAQIGFAEWTSDGRLRQPRFLRLRDDKRPAEVVRERPW